MRTPLRLTVALLAALGLASCAGDSPQGLLVSATEIAADDPGYLDHTRAWRYEYRTETVSGDEVVATAMVVRSESASDDDAPVVLWGHPTRGLADACTPSLEGPATIPDLDSLLEPGWTVVAPDFEGLGGEGLHPYLVGASEGRSSLDAVAAAREISGAGVGPDSPAVFWGFSQGGHAVVAAAEMAGPDEQPVGVAVAAPVVDVVSFAERALETPGQLGVFAALVAGYAAAYDDVVADEILTPDGAAELGVFETGCMDEIALAYDAPVHQIVADPDNREGPLWDRMDQNLAGTGGLDVPVLVIQGTDDDVVDPAATAAMAQRLCEAGTAVTHIERPGEDHAVRSVDLVPDWLADRLAGEPAPDEC